MAEPKFKVGDPVIVKGDKFSPYIVLRTDSHAMVTGRYVEGETGRDVYVTTVGEKYEEQLLPEES